MLEPDYAVFDLAYENRDCQERILSRPTSTGTYRIEGDRVVFTVSPIVETRQDFIFEGRLYGHRLVVTGHASVPLEFSGRWIEHVPRPDPLGDRTKPIGAAHALIEIDGSPVDVPSQVTPCTHGFLIMEPDFRVFELEIHEHDPCEPHSASFERWRWFGTYGQSGDELIFVAPVILEDEQDTRFSGRIEGATIRVMGPLGRSLAFANTGFITTW